jgi:hypothetical protein
MNMIGSEAVEARVFDCPNIECGAVFSYRRVSCGHFVPPIFCPMCSQPMDLPEGLTIDLTAEYPSETSADCGHLQGQPLTQLLD